MALRTLCPTNTKRIATLINTIEVSHELIKHNYASKELWLDARDCAVITLADDYGIQLPALEISRQRHRDFMEQCIAERDSAIAERRADRALFNAAL